MPILRQIALLGQLVLRKMGFSGFLARVFRHEFDHVQGLVFIDMVESTRELITEKEFTRSLQP